MSTALAHRLPARKSFRETQFEVREEAILDATHRLLAVKGYEPMAMDDIAAEVGIAKGSLYKHFESKDALVAAVMIRLLKRTRDALAALPVDLSAGERLAGLLRWTLNERLAGGVPHLPSTSQVLRDSLLGNRHYVDELLQLSEDVSVLIRAAKAEGSLRGDLDDEFILYTFYARSCDPTLDFLRLGGSIPDARIVDQLVTACFGGIGPAIAAPDKADS
ncbi:MAG TPA: helix-turn-helix domain-containing protein [Burkholderiaceae bacterium]|nr:helix-turn-helix domain-containing protein [Burkholderiaceae bacterium]